MKIADMAQLPVENGIDLTIVVVHEIAAAVIAVLNHRVFNHGHVVFQPDGGLLHNGVSLHGVFLPDALPGPDRPFIGLSGARFRGIESAEVFIAPVDGMDGGEMAHELVAQGGAQFGLERHTQPGHLAAVFGLYGADHKGGN